MILAKRITNFLDASDKRIATDWMIDRLRDTKKYRYKLVDNKRHSIKITKCHLGD